jgi:hypothetical protein
MYRRMTLPILAIILLSTLIVSTANGQQWRNDGDRISGPMHIQAIRMATANAWNVMDGDVRSARFPGYAARDFDRTRDQEFLTEGSGWGLFDLSHAIIQYTHDGVDLDGDGVPGFYELECERAAAGVELDPNDPQTNGAVGDGMLDCDGDGQTNLFEVQNGLNPLDPNDIHGDVDGDGTSNIDEIDNATFTPAYMRLWAFEPTEDELEGMVGIMLVVNQPEAAQAPTGTTVVLKFDPTALDFHSADWSSEFKRLNPGQVAQAALYQFGAGGCSRPPLPATCVRLANPQHFQFGGVGPFGPVIRPVPGEPHGGFALFYFRPLRTARTAIHFAEADMEVFPAAAQSALTYGRGAIGNELVLEVRP